jgi:tRNA dimethylallyltransferase
MTAQDGKRTRVFFLVGQTASGKGSAGVLLAQRLGAEIISLDSMKVYRGMDVATAKAPPDLRRRVPHHLLDVADPGETFSTARWVELADAAVADIRGRGRVPVVSGGTVLYLKALLEGLFEGPSADADLRARLKAEAGAHGTAALHARLTEVDPEAAERIHPNDLRRIVRALEVWEIAGEPISALQQQWGRRRRYDALVVAIRRSPDDLARRIEARVRRMADAGLLDEVQRLAEREGGLAHGPRQALGYAEVLDHLAGKADWEETLERIAAHTRQFARRQTTWLKRFEGIHWLDAGPETRAEDLAGRVVALWREREADHAER